MYLGLYRQNFASRWAEKTGSAPVCCSSFIARCSVRTDRTSLRLMPGNPAIRGRALRVRRRLIFRRTIAATCRP